MRWHASYAHLPTGLATDVLLVADEGRWTRIEPGVPAGQATADGAERLPGAVLPGLANCHSHAFHRVLRGRTHAGGGTFWTWREAMYAVAARLDPDSYLALARAAYAEMALAGVSAVGEFHYLHHGAAGQPYDDPNAMGLALVEAAAQAGIRLTLLDTCYLAGGLGPEGHLPLEGTQLLFGDGAAGGAACRSGRMDPFLHGAESWRDRVSLLRDHGQGGPEHLRVGAAIHSVRAVPREALRIVAEQARGRGPTRPDESAQQRSVQQRSVQHRTAQRDGAPLHLHLSEQPAENQACVAAYGLTPTGLLAQEGVLGQDLSAVHATHLTEADIGLLGAAGVTACFCPTTERDLADGIGPARALADAGASLSLGSDQHAVVDLLEEARALEMHERLASRQRGRFTPEQLLAAATAHGSIGWPDAGRIEVGTRADLVAVRLDTVRTAGTDPAQVLLAATAADVDTVVVDGRTVVSAGQHVLGDVGHLLRAAIAPLWEEGH